MTKSATSRLITLLFGIAMVVLIALLVREVARLRAENRRQRGVNDFLRGVAKDRRVGRRARGVIHRFADTLED